MLSDLALRNASLAVNGKSKTMPTDLVGAVVLHDLINKLGRYIDESASLANPDVPDHSGRDFPEFRKNEHQLFHLEALLRSVGALAHFFESLK